MIRPVPHEPPVAESEEPRLAGFRSWRKVYCFVLGWFVAFVILLALFTYAFS